MSSRPITRTSSVTPAGRQRLNAFDPEGPREKRAGFNPAPGAIDSAWEPYDPLRLYEMSVPGIYIIQHVYQEGWMKPVRSNRIQVVAKRHRPDR